MKGLDAEQLVEILQSMREKVEMLEIKAPDELIQELINTVEIHYK
ncbi:hypothetical protein [Bacillus solimangrovi]|nr:hypothetical protein [Bacillus solimangrovi]